jgi:hypothetical protein
MSLHWRDVAFSLLSMKTGRMKGMAAVGQEIGKETDPKLLSTRQMSKHVTAKQQGKRQEEATAERIWRTT